MPVVQIPGVSIKPMSVPVTKPSARGEMNPSFLPGVDFDRDAFTALVYDKGYSVLWEKGVTCPNRGGVSPRSHPADCPHCDGFGFVYYGAETTQMFVLGMSLHESYYAYGRWDNGTVQVTAMPEFQLGYWDRLTLLNSTGRFQQLVTRQRNTVVDRLKYEALSVELITWIGRDKQRRVAASTDYALVDGQVSWIANKPDPDMQYAISYTYRQRYIITELPHQHRDSTVKGVHYVFPMQAIAKLDFLIRDEGKDAPAYQVEDPLGGR